MRSWILLAAIGCAGHAEPPHAPPLAETDAPPAADAKARIAIASQRWLAGDLASAISELRAAGGDPDARALLVRALVLTGRLDEARQLAHRATGRTTPKLELAHDVSTLDGGVAISRDGAYVATSERGWGKQTTTTTVWSTLSGRALFSVPGNQLAFGALPGGAELVVVIDESNEAHAYDAATGRERWHAGFGRTYDLAIDRHGEITTIEGDKSTLVQWRLATGERVRDIPNDSNGAVLSLAADGSTALSAETLFDLAGSPPVKLGVLPAATMVSGVADMRLSPDGRLVAISHINGAVTLTTRDGREVVTIPAAGTQAEFLDDNTVIATNGKHVTRWDTTGKSLGAYDLPADLTTTNGFNERFVIGQGGHAVLRRGRELVVLDLRAPEPLVIATLGFAARAKALAWSEDGGSLAMLDAADDIVEWSATGGAHSAGRAARSGYIHHLRYEHGEVDATDEDDDTLAIAGKRLFVRDTNLHVVRMVEAPDELTTAVIGGGLLVAAGALHTIYVWKADTGEGLGEFAAAGDQILAIAVRPDGRVLAIARAGGAVELWDLPSRTRRLSLIAWGDQALAIAPDGRFDGDAHPLAWIAGDARFPGELVGTPARGLAATVLAHPPPAVAIAPTPALVLAPLGCLPAGDDLEPKTATLAGSTLAFCVGRYQGDPYCFSADLATKRTTPRPPDLDLMAPAPHYRDRTDHFPTIMRERDEVTVCHGEDDCKTFTVNGPQGDSQPIALSADGTIAAIGAQSDDTIETWDVATGKRIARFRARYPSTQRESPFHQLGFWSHDVLAINTPCAGPCSSANIFTATGASLGALPLEASEMTKTRWYDDVWLLEHTEGGFVLMSETTGRVLLDRSARGHFAIAHDATRVAAVLGKGEVQVFDRRGKLVAKIPAPRCRDSGD